MKNFIRAVEDFECANCEALVTGNGFTNHCPVCLYSKHVDKDVPGDRLSECTGLMSPVSVDYSPEKSRILHVCVACGHEKWNKCSPYDDVGVLVEICRNAQH